MPHCAAVVPAWHHLKAKGGDSAKKQRKDLLNLLLTWGAPAVSSSSRRTSEDAAAAAAAPVDGGTAAGEVYDWEGWGGRGEMTPSLLRANSKQLTAMLKVRYTLRQEVCLWEFHIAGCACWHCKHGCMWARGDWWLRGQLWLGGYEEQNGTSCTQKPKLIEPALLLLL